MPQTMKSDAVKIDASVRRVLGKRLRATYQIVDEPLPDEHVHLLLALRHKERDRSRRG